MDVLETMNPADAELFVLVCRISKTYTLGRRVTVRLSQDAIETFPTLRKAILVGLRSLGGERKSGLAPRSNAHKKLLSSLGR